MSWNLKILRPAVSLTVGCVLLVGCNLPGSSSQENATQPTSAPVDCSPLKNILVQSYFEQLTEPLHNVTGPVELNVVRNPAQAASLIATDQRGLVYTLVDGVLTIRRLTLTGSVEVLGELPVPVALLNAEIFLDAAAARVIISGHESLLDLKQALDVNIRARRLISDGSIDAGRAVAVVINVSEPERPVIIQQVHMEGALIARAHAHGQLHLITRAPLSVPDVVKNDVEVRNGLRILAERRAAGIDIADAERALRDALEHALANDIASAQRAAACTDFIRPANTAPVREKLMLTSISAEGQVLNSVPVYGARQSVYAAPSSLYVLQTLAAGSAATTSIAQFELNATGANYKRSALVSGIVSGIDEQDGVLRIVTTQPASDGMHEDMTLTALAGTSSNSVLEPLASAELLHATLVSAVKFSGHQLFVATHAESTRLHIFDIEDVNHPQVVVVQEHAAPVEALLVLGKDRLMIGYTLPGIDASAQLHLRVLDIAFADGQAQVSECGAFAAGQMKSSLSTARQLEQAVIFYEPRGILAIPVTETGAQGELQFSGIVVYDLNRPEECEEIARVTAVSPIPATIGSYAGIVQVGVRFFLLRISPGEFQAVPLEI